VSSGRPLGLVQYACGHSDPVRGAGGRVKRPCHACADTPRRANHTGLGMLRLEQLLGRRPTGYQTSFYDEESPNVDASE
jgi:hypothetical protein